MECCSFPTTTPLIPTPSSTPSLFVSQFPISTPKLPPQPRFSHSTLASASLKRPKGFGPSPTKTQKRKKPNKNYSDDEDDQEEEEEEEAEAGVIPEIVTNRMISRMGFSVGIPVTIGLLFFPFFYYLKMGLKIDVPTWIPLIVSFFFLGSALLGVSYGIVSSSWDPLREGSFLGWTEAKKNWPVFWESLWGRSGGKK